MKRVVIIGILLTVLLPMGIVEGSSATEPLVFSVLYNEDAATPFQEDWLILDEYAKRQDVVLDVRLASNEDYEHAIIRAIESGNIPDIVLKVWPDTIESYATTGILLAFSDYEHLMPHFEAYIEEHDLGSELDRLRLENGKYYILPGYRRTTQVQQWIYRRDLFEAHDLGVPDTYEDLFACLVFLKDIYPDATPITACWGGAHLLAMMGAGYGIPAGWAGTRDYDPEQDRWRFSPATENYRELYGFLNRCYQAGILDPEIFTQTDAEYYAKILDGKALVTVSWITSGFSSWNETLQKNGVSDGEWAPLPVPESTMGIRALPAVDPFKKGLIVPSRVVKEPYFEDLLHFLDWAVYSEEGMTLTTWGVDGITFEQTPNGRSFLPQIQTTINPDGIFDMTEEYGLATLFDLNENEEFEDYRKPAEIVEFLERSLEAGETAEMPPQLKLSSTALEAISTIKGTIEAYADEASHDFITGHLNINTDWDNYIHGLEQRGYLTLEAIWNTAWEEQNE